MTSGATSAAQDEYDTLVKAGSSSTPARHPEDEQHRSDDEGSEEPREHFPEKDDEDDSDNDDYNTSLRKQQSEMRSRYFLPRIRHEANTGPKGVIADAQAFESAKKAQRFTFLRSSKDAPAAIEKNVDTDNEDGFLERWRQNRLAELQDPEARTSMANPRSRTVSPGKRKWGYLATVDAEGFLDAVEHAPEKDIVVVYIYDDASDISDDVEDCVRQLAQWYKHTRFIRMHYEEAEIEVAGVPAILAYKGGDKCAGLLPVINEMPDDAELKPETLEKVLQKHQIL